MQFFSNVIVSQLALAVLLINFVSVVDAFARVTTRSLSVAPSDAHHDVSLTLRSAPNVRKVSSTVLLINRNDDLDESTTTIVDTKSVSTDTISTITTSGSSMILPPWISPLIMAAWTGSLMVLNPQNAFADSPDWGLFEGRTGSLLHPIMMGGLFLYSAYTAFLGFQWRRQRTIGDEISDLKKSMPNLGSATSVKEALTMARTDASSVPVSIMTLEASLETETKIQSLIDERKSLVQAAPRDQHYAQGALLAFLGTAFAIEGCLNTFSRTGKLFPGPHLYVGAALVVIWSLAVAMIPSMQKGNETARSIHIGANAIGMAFFAWQVTSGLPILFKVIENTKWP